MGNVHATLMQFNNSAQSYADALKIQPQFDAAKSRRHAVLCHHKLEQALEEQHRYVVIFGSNLCYKPILTKFQKDYQFLVAVQCILFCHLSPFIYLGVLGI